jgi:hypothetical protein
MARALLTETVFIVENNFFSQCSTPLVDMRFCRHLPNSPRYKNKVLHNPCLLEKVSFLAFKTLLPPFGIRNKNFFVNFKYYDLANGNKRVCKIWWICKHRTVSYKILWLKVLNEALILLNSPCF